VPSSDNPRRVPVFGV